MTVAEKVQYELDKKQASKEFKDVEERVAGSRKEKAQYRKLSMEDYRKVESESPALANDLVTKERIIQDKYDPAIDKESGTPAGVVFMKEKLLSAIGKKPEAGKEFREAYVQDVPEMYQKIAEAKSLNELKDIASENFIRMSNGVVYRADRGIAAEAVFGKRFLDLITERTQ